MKIIHCADLHLDSSFKGNLDEEKARERRAELLSAFERMVAYADQNEVRAILIAGDLFDREQISRTTMDVVYQTIAAHPDINFYYLRGNHDADSFVESLEEIPDNLGLFENEWVYYEEGAVTIAGIELGNRTGMAACNTLQLDRQRINIVMLHGQTEPGRTTDIPQGIALAAWMDKGIDYLALGHVHAYKEAALDGRGVWCYSGCLEGRGFDECGEHGFVLLDIAEDTRQIKRTFVPFAKRKLWEIPVDISGCETVLQIRQQIEEKLAEELVEGRDLLKIILTGSVPVVCDKNPELLKKYFEDRFYLFRMADHTKTEISIDEYRLDESLKGEFVRLVLADDALDETLSGEVIRCGLQALAGEEIG